ncbi:hypothetical protein WKI65_32255 [Streptomyces sp. MS1.AVA.3]|uniref:hypothetical protein n=1 Tax=Streptomyces decoyicus TaxID=249567 RepID=UPI0030BB956E
MLDRLTRHSSAPADDARIFLRICDPVPLTDPGSAPRALVDEEYLQGCVTIGWREAFAQLPQSLWHVRAELAAHRHRCRRPP